MQHRIGRTMVTVALAAAALTIPIAVGTAGAQDTLTFSVGTTQDIDTLNVTAGFLVIDYEIWNLTLPTLTDKAANDFTIRGGLAESWTESDGGLTWTYTMREGMQWSDGEPLTADDIVYTITAAVEEEWQNHISTTGNLTATATDERTVVVTSSVPDPKLPMLDMYIVPKHMYETISAEDMPNYPADDNIAGGPFRIVERREGEFMRLEQNPNWYGQEPAMDQVIFQIFENPEAQYNALRAGDLDAVDEVPAQIYPSIVDGSEENIDCHRRQPGWLQRAGDELRLRVGHRRRPHRRSDIRGAPGDQLGDRPRPPRRQGVERATASPGVSIIPSANPSLDLEVRDDERYTYNPESADDAARRGGLDRRQRQRHPREGRRGAAAAVLRSLGRRRVGDHRVPHRMAERRRHRHRGADQRRGHADRDRSARASSTCSRGDGCRSWIRIRMLSATSPATRPRPIRKSSDTTMPTGATRSTTSCTNSSRSSSTSTSGAELVQQACSRSCTTEAPYAVLYKYDDLQAIRSDRWENFVRQPAETGPVLFTNTSPAYLALTSTVAAASGGGHTGLISAPSPWLPWHRRRRIVAACTPKGSDDDRE